MFEKNAANTIKYPSFVGMGKKCGVNNSVVLSLENIVPSFGL